LVSYEDYTEMHGQQNINIQHVTPLCPLGLFQSSKGMAKNCEINNSATKSQIF